MENEEYDIQLKEKYTKEELVKLINDLQTFGLFFSENAQYSMTMFSFQEKFKGIEDAIDTINFVIDKWL